MLRAAAFWSLASAIFALPALIGCRTSTLGPWSIGCGVTSDSLLTVCVGQEVRAPDGVMRVALLGVRNDSRCPVDAECFWEGNAQVEIGVAVGMGPTVPYVINSGVEPRAVDIGTYRLTLAALWPDRVSTRSIPGDRYVATLRLGRIWGPD